MAALAVFLGMELTPLRYFREIAAQQHLTRAARSLGVTQPALSAVVKKLERDLGATLLHRTGRGVELTEAGQVFLRHAKDALAAAEAGLNAVRQLQGLERGSIRVGGGATATAYLLPGVVRALRSVHPGLRFFIREVGSAQVAEAVIRGELDLGIVTLPVDVPDAEVLLRVPLVQDELRLIVPPGHRLNEPDTARNRSDPTRGSFRWKDVEREPFVAFEAGTAVRAVVDAAVRHAGVTLDVVMELRSIEPIKSMVAAGIGVALVSRFALPVGAGLTCRDGRLTRQLAIIRRRDREPSAGSAAFERQLLATARELARA